MALGREKREITVSITEARRRLSWLVDFAYNGGEVIITKWGVPRARMISAKKRR
ncbi:MAG: type II toxin-antitoxin system Phd/YefM family antitoxin [Acidobacteriaceae bacterium]